MNKIEKSELPLNADGSIYHIHIHPEQLADTIILVGDPGRVPFITELFDNVEFRMQNREIVTHTGTYKGKRITVLSTGMGCDNVDIVLNELDALANIDLQTGLIKENKKSLNLVRIGTSGSFQLDIPVHSIVVADYAIGMDGLAYFYDKDFNKNSALNNAFQKFITWPENWAKPYFAKCSENLFDKIFDNDKMLTGITVSASGFFGPQGRQLRLPLPFPDVFEKLSNFDYNGHRITNMEMETSALYSLGSMLDHEALSVNLIVVNRRDKSFSENYKPAMKEVAIMILDKI